MSARLERSTTNKAIAGVCGGIAEYLQIDATLVRVFFVIAAVMTAGLGFLGYLVLLVMMPLPGQAAPFVKTGTTPGTTGTAATSGTNDPSETTLMTPAASTPPDPVAADRRRASFGYLLVALGVVFLLSNIGVFHIVRWDLVWPFVFIGAGLLLLAQRIRS
ncbi:MAG: PspC domain-containing protein [Chloroflexota bacterium]|nr:PspC domain-containing protein [Chloroflexota bacterium]